MAVASMWMDAGSETVVFQGAGSFFAAVASMWMDVTAAKKLPVPWKTTISLPASCTTLKFYLINLKADHT